MRPSVMRLAALCLLALLLPLVPDSSALAQSPGREAAHRVGGEEPLPAVPQRSRFPAPRRGLAQRRRARLRAAAGDRERRPRLGARHGRAPVRRSRRPADGILRARRHARGLSLARATIASASCSRGAVPDNVTCVWTFEDGASEPRADRRLPATKRCGCASCTASRPPHRVDIVLPDGTAQRVVTEIAGARRADRRPRRFDRRRRRQSRPAGAALRRRLLLPPLPRRRDRANTTGPAAPALAATAPA